MFKLKTLHSVKNSSEKGSALLFSVMASLVGLALAFILMATTTQNLNVAFFNTKDLRLTTANSNAVETAIQLINSGYDATIHDENNPYIIRKTVFVNGVEEILSQTEWWVEKTDMTLLSQCSKNLGGYDYGTVEYLLVGGGGSGGSNIGGGGGAGGFLEGSYILTAGEHTIRVGAGGPQVTGYSAGIDGQDTLFKNLVALGGGGGGAVDSNGNIIPARLGGSGGGASKNISTTGTTLGGLGTPGQGSNGAPTVNEPLTSPAGSGGGGANNTGTSGINSVGGDGGNGLASTISGISKLYAGGGGGSTVSGGTAGAGGSGGGGSGGIGSGPGGTATPNSGGGGGGAYDPQTVSGAGANGVAIIRYPIEINNIPTGMFGLGGNVDVYTEGNTKYRTHLFNETGQTIFNLINTGAPKHTCGLTIKAKTTTPYYSDEDEYVTETFLSPYQTNSADIINNIVEYSPTMVSIFRHGLFAKNNLTLNDGTKLFSYYADDTLTPVSTILNENMSLGLATLAAGNKIEINSTNISPSDIQSATVEAKTHTNNVFIHADCEIGEVECGRTILNKQNYKTSLSLQETTITSMCENETPILINSSSQLQPGLTCTDNDVFLKNNTVLGTFGVPTVLIVDGNVTIESGARLNENRPARFLQIYATGDITINADTDEDTYVNALLSTGTGDIVSTTTGAGKIFLNGAQTANNITTNGDVTIWLDLTAKFINNPEATTMFQKINTRSVFYKQKAFTIGDLGRAFDPRISQESTVPENVNTAGGGDN